MLSVLEKKVFYDEKFDMEKMLLKDAKKFINTRLEFVQSAELTIII